MARVRVPVHRTSPTQSVLIDPAATVGAQIGVNLLLPDGTVGTLAQLSKLFGSTATAGTGTITTTDDVEEGQWNLWFTNLRAQNAVGGILADSANVTLAYVGGTSITADLTALTDSGAGALLATTFDAKGRKTGSRAATITGTAGRITVANGDASAGLPTIDLAPVTDAGGGVLQKTAFDAYGRVSGTSAATTTDLAEGSNLYFTAARVLASILTGLSTATSAVISATDTVLSALGKLQAQVTANLATLTGHTSNTSNPHNVTAAQVGLGNVDNTSDVNKPVSTPQAAALALKQDISGLGTAAFVNTGNVGAGVVPLLSVNAGQTTLALTGVTGRVAFSLTTAEADGAVKPVFQISGLGGPSTSGSAEQRVAIFSASTDGTTANKRGGAFAVALKQDGSDTLINRFNVGYLGHTTPGVDNVQTMGSSALRWSVVYAGTGTINTSDAREKTAVTPLTLEELAAASDLARAIGTYQWLESVQLKGADARHHAGLTVQQAIAIMQAHGLDPFRYGFICYDAWDELPETRDEEGKIVQEHRPAGDRYSFRTDELLLFIARGFAARLDALETAR